ncbi:hypothetical protein B0H13DRAFT_1936455, partial [Mycena leptocephala]
SGSLSLLPAFPKIFHGRDSELKDIIEVLLCERARAAILGPGGIGKTTLAMAALHHPAIMEKYGLMHFISCESAWNPRLSSQDKLCSTLDNCLVVLDNVETPWEPVEFREQVEQFLSLLADIQSFALLVTMRGAQRPGKVKWTRPFLPPLEPLPPSASRQIFVEVADEPGNDEESALDDLLELSDSLPLASTPLRVPHAKNLISLLSLLPDGIKPEHMVAGKVPIPNVRQCQSVLLSTSLAYIDIRGRLKALAPVREYIRRAYPPSASLARSLRTHFLDLFEVWRSKIALPSGNLVPDLLSHLGNINQLILEGLSTEEKSARIEWERRWKHPVGEGTLFFCQPMLH